MIPVDRALALVLEHTPSLGAEPVDFVDAAGRILAEDVRADRDLPPFPRAMMDGFAVRSEDLAAPPRRLRIVGVVPAGRRLERSLGPGEAAQIMTGAPVPDGADAVEMIERCRVENDTVTLSAPVAPGQNVAPRGSEVRAGELVLRRGTRIDPAAVSVAATVGKTRLLVGRRPRVAIVSTGDELVDPHETPGPAEIRNSNGFALLAAARGAGAEARFCGVARDEEEAIERRVRDGLEGDALVLSGGVSAGRFDFVEAVLERLGVRLLVDAVALRPGKPFVFGVGPGKKPVFGLPGNPVSALVTFELFVRPALAKMAGAERPERPLLAARLGRGLASRGPRRAYLPGWLHVEPEGGGLVAEPIDTKGSADIVAFAKANALLVVPEDVERIEAGASVRVYPLDAFLDKEDRWHLASPS